MIKPRLFIASSGKALPFAKAVSTLLSTRFACTIWNEVGVFPASGYPLDSLLDQVRKADLGLFVFNEDDIAEVKGQVFFAVRDNVVFEAGLFFGSLGRDASFVLCPDSPDLRIPSDLEGLTQLRMKESTTPQAAVRKACKQLVEQCMGPARSSLVRALSGTWQQTWYVEGSSSYPRKNISAAQVFALGSRMRAQFTVDREKYELVGKIHSGNLITGVWSGPTDLHYHGSFQLAVGPRLKTLNGTWLGFRRDRTSIHSGEWQWKRN